MKKLFFSLLSLFLVTGVLMAQDPGKAFKEAKKANSKFATADEDKKEEYLTAALASINTATEGIDAFEGKNLTKVWLLRGEIYNALADWDVKKTVIDQAYVPKDKNSALEAFNAFKMTIETATKSYFKKDAINGLKSTASHLGNFGLMAFNRKDYATAFENYKTVLDLKELLEANDNNEVLSVEEDFNRQMYLTGMCAMGAEKNTEALTYLEKLYAKGYDEAGLYDALYKLKIESSEEEALDILSKGRLKYPDDEGLRVAEINYYMSNNKFDELVGKLQKAIEADPKNLSYYNALGNTFDNLFQNEAKNGDKAKAQEYFDNALSYYNQALEVDGTNFFALYNIGVLYVNKANGLVGEMKALEDKGDYSKAGLRAVEAKKSEADKEFAAGLPFFQKAEALNPNDINTLIALKEIYARSEDFEKSNEFKKRMETVEAGGTNDSSFFSN